MRTGLKLIPLWVAVSVAALGQSVPVSPLQGTELVRRALAAELNAAQDRSHPMRFELRKTSPRLTTTKEILETRDGSVAMLRKVNDLPPSDSDAKKEQQRLDGLLADPGKQRHRKQSQEEDTERALKVLRALPDAFIYQYAGTVTAGPGGAAKFTFTPNPSFEPPDLETEVLTALTGEIWIDPVQVRVMHLHATLEKDVEFGWGVLGRLYKGGWINMDSADVGEGVWRVVRFQMNMSARVLIRTKQFETTEEESHFSPVPAGLDYRGGIALLRAGAAGQVAPAGR
ncbi:hypothetical protein [Occallatibacter riparius]|uniref:Outer membrane lipoprotein-sorting protein n=1 Tax=Occallatibacter riparius TaxID=1002689 RepID=A0A9J7BK41_9BACT|nr:hypothetical protein [Occallatibacter riparius]UWZ83200.1 hypothetical protein MOP44_21845 [Occallatibacter riparius]